MSYSLKGPNKLSKIYVTINDDSEDKHVNFISISGIDAYKSVAMLI